VSHTSGAEAPLDFGGLIDLLDGSSTRQDPQIVAE
jgi:hypothetical protein